MVAACLARTGALAVLFGLSGCNVDDPGAIDQILFTDSYRSSGYLIEARPLGDFVRDKVEQLGALYYVRRGGTLSETAAVDIDVACAVVAGYGTFQPVEGRHLLDAQVTRTIGGHLGMPKLFQTFLGPIGADLSAEYKVDAKFSKVTIRTLSDGDLATLSDRFDNSDKCAAARGRIKEPGRGTVFQLVGVVYADVAGAITKSGGGNITLGAVSGTNGATASSAIKFDLKQTVFRLYRPG